MGYLRAKDTVNGALGTCFAIIDGKRHELMQVKNIQAKVKKTRMTIPILGMTAKQQKSGGWEGTGTMTVYYVSSLFRQISSFSLCVIGRIRQCVSPQPSANRSVRRISSSALSCLFSL